MSLCENDSSLERRGKDIRKSRRKKIIHQNWIPDLDERGLVVMSQTAGAITAQKPRLCGNIHEATESIIAGSAGSARPASSNILTDQYNIFPARLSEVCVEHKKFHYL